MFTQLPFVTLFSLIHCQIQDQISAVIITFSPMSKIKTSFDGAETRYNMLTVSPQFFYWCFFAIIHFPPMNIIFAKTSLYNCTHSTF